MISILTPTRNSPIEFKSMVDSLVETCSNKLLVEILVKIDDDTDDRKYVENTLKGSGFQYAILSSPRGRSNPLDMPRYVDELFKISKGLIVWVFPDDVVIINGDWVKHLMDTRNKVTDNIYIVYSKYASKMSQARSSKFRGSGNGIPILSREIYNRMGGYGRNNVPADCYIRGISNAISDRTFYIDIYTAQKFSSRRKNKLQKKKLSSREYDNIVRSMGINPKRLSRRIIKENKL